MPSSSMRNFSLSISHLARSASHGQGNRCFSRRFCHRQNPVRSQYNAFSIRRSPLQNKNRADSNTLDCITCSTISARPLICFLMSVGPGRTNTLASLASKAITDGTP